MHVTSPVLKDERMLIYFKSNYLDFNVVVSMKSS